MMCLWKYFERFGKSKMISIHYNEFIKYFIFCTNKAICKVAMELYSDGLELLNKALDLRSNFDVEVGIVNFIKNGNLAVLYSFSLITY